MRFLILFSFKIQDPPSNRLPKPFDFIHQNNEGLKEHAYSHGLRSTLMNADDVDKVSETELDDPLDKTRIIGISNSNRFLLLNGFSMQEDIGRSGYDVTSPRIWLRTSGVGVYPLCAGEELVKDWTSNGIFLKGKIREWLKIYKSKNGGSGILKEELNRIDADIDKGLASDIIINRDGGY
ncbi:hypothetical protein Tco_0196094 [Tanacetum coccineum]